MPLFEKLALAALAVITFVVADEVGGNGFIAALVGGGAAGVAAGPVTLRALDFAEEDGELLNLAVFFIFGIFASHVLGDASWQIVAYAGLSLTLIRLLPVALSIIGLGLRPATIGFLAWFGPRGLASIILGLVVVEDAPSLQGIEQIFVVMTVTVLLSVFAHGITAAPLSRRFARAREHGGADEPAHEPVGEIPSRWPSPTLESAGRPWSPRRRSGRAKAGWTIFLIRAALIGALISLSKHSEGLSDRVYSRGWLRASMQTVIARTSASSCPGAIATP